MTGRIGVRLEIGHPGIRQALEQYIASLDDFLLRGEDDAGLPQLLILELDPSDAAETFARIRAIQQSSPSTDIFLTSTRMDPQLLLEVLRAGVKEFLTQPLRPEEVQQAFQRFRERNAEAAAGELKRSGKIFAVIGGKSGVGTSTIAAGLAAALRAGSSAVAVVDLNLRGGDLPAFFDVNPLRSIRDIDLDLSRLDNAFLGGIMMKHSSGVEVLPLGDTDLAGGQVSSECVDRTLKLMRSMYDFVVVDCGHNIDMATYAALNLSAGILLVTALTVPVVRRTKRLLDGLRGEDGSGLDPACLHLVVNSYVERDSLILAEARDVLNSKPQWILPRDAETVTDALNNGQPMVLHAPRAPLSKAVQKMATDLGGGPATKSSFLSGFFRSATEKSTKSNSSPSAA
jgi:pilus assembly protein CpaE